MCMATNSLIIPQGDMVGARWWESEEQAAPDIECEYYLIPHFLDI